MPDKNLETPCTGCVFYSRKHAGDFFAKAHKRMEDLWNEKFEPEYTEEQLLRCLSTRIKYHDYSAKREDRSAKFRENHRKHTRVHMDLFGIVREHFKEK